MVSWSSMALSGGYLCFLSLNPTIFLFAKSIQGYLSLINIISYKFLTKASKKIIKHELKQIVMINVTRYRLDVTSFQWFIFSFDKLSFWNVISFQSDFTKFLFPLKILLRYKIRFYAYKDFDCIYPM